MDYSDRMSMGNGMLEMAIFQKKGIIRCKTSKIHLKKLDFKNMPKTRTRRTIC